MSPERPRVGYVAKVFPRLSETFIVAELLAQERAGLDVEVFSLRESADVGAHAAHRRLRAPVTYLPTGVTVASVLDELRAAGELGDVGATVRDARDEHPRELLQALRLARLVRERRIDHLHAHFASVSATVTRLASRLAGVPYSVTAHAKDIFHEDVVPERLRRVLGDAAAVVTVSDFNVSYLAGACPALAPGRVHRIYNGLELEAFPYRSPDERPPRIVGVGRLVEKKGFADLVDACALLANAGRRFECRIVGGGMLEAELRGRVAARGLEAIVTLTGPASQEVVRAEMTAAAALAAPCLVGIDGNRDGLPTVLLEAMALGTPCVATPVTGIPEVLDDGRTGLMVPERTPAALAAALASLLDDAELRVRLASEARRLIEERFDVDRNVAAWRGAVLGGAAREEIADARRVRVH